MLLKCSTLDKRAVPSKGKGKAARLSPGIKMTVNSTSNLNSRIHRKGLRIPAKRHPGKALPGKLHALSKLSPGKLTPGKRIISRPNPPPCDNSNDSGLGFDQHVESTFPNTAIVRPLPSTRLNEVIIDDQRKCHSDEIYNNVKSNTIETNAKRLKIDNVNIESDDTCSNDAFFFVHRQKEEITPQPQASSTSIKLLNSTLTRNISRPTQKRMGNSVTLQSQIGSMSRDGSCQLQILVQPEQQHRARYQTEGSRGAVKDRSGNGFPIVKLAGYTKPTVLQVFIGTDVGRVTPHMFYQACKVSGKNSTPCVEKKLDGTIVIEIELKPDNEMTVTCDCVGILKERNVDVEHRFPEQSGPRSKKKSTRCRMVFRTLIVNDDGSTETLQVCSQQIICTQPPGVPEICKKSLVSCPASGGLELFIIGKNFLKDTRVIFQAQRNDSTSVEPLWEDDVIPDKEYLQQTHLVCTVPPYINPDIKEPVNIQIFIVSSGKRSESHNFVYTPKGTYSILSASTTNGILPNQNSLLSSSPDITYNDDLWKTNVEPKNEIDSDMMPPPCGLPLTIRRSSSAGNIVQDQLSPKMNNLKAELLDENSQNSIVENLNNESVDRYPVNSETSVKVNNSSTIKDILFNQPELRKHTLDITENNTNIPIISNDNNMEVNQIPINNFNANHMDMLPTQQNLKVIDLRVKQEEQIAAQLRDFVSNSQNIIPNINNIEANVNQLEAETVAAALFNVNSNQNNGNVFSQPIITPSTSKQLLDQPNFLGNLCNDTTTSQLNQILDIPQNHVNSEIEVINNTTDRIMSESPSNRSPLTQDIILNSQSAVLNNTNNLTNVLSNSNSPQSQHNMSPDVILNPAVSPSMMCQTSTDPNNILGQQVTLTNAMLNDITLPQTNPNSILNNLIPPVMNQQPDSLHLSHKSPIAVKNMYLNAANEILNTQPTESTINALIQMDQQPILTTQEQQVTPMIINQNSNSHRTTNDIQNQISMFNEPENVITNNVHQILSQNTLNNNNSNALMQDVNMSLLNQAVVNEQQIRVQEEFIRAANNANLSQEMSNLTQESHLQNLSLGRNVLTINEPKNVVHVNQQNVVTTSTNTTIPQDITTMSDHDLISYINPSCFDQM